MPAFTVISEPIDLSEATALASGGGFTDLDAQEMLLQYVPIGQPPFSSPAWAS